MLATTVILGAAGIAAQREDAACIVAAGGNPLAVMLVKRQDGSITLMATTVKAPERVLH